MTDNRKVVLVLLSSLVAVLIIGIVPAFLKKKEKDEEQKAVARQASPIRNYFDEPRKLRRCFDKEYTFSDASGTFSASGFFFIAVGGVDARGTFEQHTSYKTFITFAWQSDDGYVISKLPLERVRVNPSDDNKIPTVKFQLNTRTIWHDDIRNFKENLPSFFETSLNYVVINCREADWPLKLEMPLTNK